MTLRVTPRGEGRPIFVLPSFSLDHHAMTEVFDPAFAGTSGWMRLYVDLPGTGESPTGEPRSDAVLDALEHTIESTLGNQRFAVAGWSYGGYLAAGLARRRPRQLAGLMMVCTGFKIRPQDRNLTGVLSSVPEPGWLSETPPLLRDHFTHAIGCQTLDVARRVSGVLALNSPTDDAYLAALRGDGFALSDEHVPSHFDRPTSFLSGRRDRVAGYVDLFESLDRFHHSDYLAAGNVGHYLPLEVPGLFKAAVLTWLNQCRPFLNKDPGRHAAGVG